MAALPGGPIANRPLHFVWILDCSGSMSGSKIGQLNFAIKDAIPEMQAAAASNPNAQVLVRAVTFSSGARWHIAKPVNVADFKWADVSAGGVTDMGAALSLVAQELHVPPMSDRALPPVLVLISDGQPTDNFGSGLRSLMNEPWGQKAVRLAVAIGQDADTTVLDKFIDNAEVPCLVANNANTLATYIRWLSTAVLKAASAPPSQPPGTTQGPGAVPIPTPPPAAPGGHVW